jgi:hypothetical protein
LRNHISNPPIVFYGFQNNNIGVYYRKAGRL